MKVEEQIIAAVAIGGILLLAEYLLNRSTQKPQTPQQPTQQPTQPTGGNTGAALSCPF